MNRKRTPGRPLQVITFPATKEITTGWGKSKRTKIVPHPLAGKTRQIYHKPKKA